MHHDIQLFAEYAVTPFVGVWIETVILFDNTIRNTVTPFVGVWIETIFGGLFGKHNTVTPFVGVWIETALKISALRSVTSHPSWVCGLKQGQAALMQGRAASHPSWVCGLKHANSNSRLITILVTPFVGVWIETYFR